MAATNPTANGPSAFDSQRISMVLVNPACMPLLPSFILHGCREQLLHLDCRQGGRHLQLFAQAFGQHQLVPKHAFESSTSHKLGGYLVSGLVYA